MSRSEVCGWRFEALLPMAARWGTFRTMLPPLTLWMLRAREYGGVAERLKAPVLKTGSGGSRS